MAHKGIEEGSNCFDITFDNRFVGHGPMPTVTVMV